MTPRPKAENRVHHGTGKLSGKVALVTGGDSGIGRAIAIAFAREGADLAIAYLDEHKDAEETKRLVEQEGRRCMAVAGDVGSHEHCMQAVRTVLRELGRLDILVNNAAEQHPQDSLDKITPAQLERTFRTNIFSYFMAQAALPHLPEGASIINTTSVTAYKGSPQLLDYSSTKGAIVSFTRSLALALAEEDPSCRGARPVDAVNPLDISAGQGRHVGSDVPLGGPTGRSRALLCISGVAGRLVHDGTGLHPNGGTVVNG